MIYKFKSGARCSVSAQVAGEECAKLEAQGRLTPRNLVEESRPDDAPLHDCFEWDDETAAEKYREAQAGYIIRSIEVVTEEIKEPTRAFVSIVKGNKPKPYKSIEVVLRNRDSREAMLDQALRELESFRHKYEQLSELAEVFSAIEVLVA